MVAGSDGLGLEVGAATRNRRPPGCPAAAFACGPIPFETVESQLSVRAIVVRSRGVTLALVSADVLWVPDGLATSIREAIARAIGTTPTFVLLNASHAHSTPPMPGMPISDPSADLAAVERFGRHFEAAAARAARDAMARFRPARLGTGRGTTPIGVYRRATDFSGRGHLGEVTDSAERILFRACRDLLASIRQGAIT